MYKHENNSLMQVAIHILFNFNDGADSLDQETKQNILCELIRHNEIVTKKYAVLKESILSSELNSGIVCFKMTLISLNLKSGIESSKLNDIINVSFLSKIFNPDYLQRCEIIASKFYNILHAVKNTNANTNQNFNFINDSICMARTNEKNQEQDFAINISKNYLVAYSHQSMQEI